MEYNQNVVHDSEIETNYNLLKIVVSKKIIIENHNR